MDLFRHNWTVDDPKGTIVLIHGTGEHHGRYHHVAAVLNQHGYSVSSGDLPGWGQSPGLKGHINDFNDYLDAVNEWVDDIHGSFPDHHPVYIMGHSLGGLIAARFVQRYHKRNQLAGLILSSPCLQLKMSVPPWKANLASFLNQLWPSLRLPNEISPQMVTRHPEVRARYRTDPFNFPRVSVRWFHELEKAMQLVWEERNKLTIPLLVLQAGDDCIIDPAGVERFVQEVSYPEKHFIMYPGLYHEIMNEPEREMVLSNLVSWLESRSNEIKI